MITVCIATGIVLTWAAFDIIRELITGQHWC